MLRVCACVFGVCVRICLRMFVHLGVSCVCMGLWVVLALCSHIVVDVYACVFCRFSFVHLTCMCVFFRILRVTVLWGDGKGVC